LVQVLYLKISGITTNHKIYLPQTQKMKVLLATTQNDFINIFAKLFQSETVYQIGTIIAEKASIYQFVITTAPDIVFFYGEASIEIIQQIKSNFSLTTRCVLVVSPSDTSFLIQGMLTLADAYMAENGNDEEYTQCIERLIAGERHISPKIIEFIFQNVLISDHDEIINKLGKKEYQVFRLIGFSYQIKNIANSLCISTNTVESHRSNIIKKLRLKDAKELRQLASKAVYSYKHNNQNVQQIAANS
jgi:DNA-binding NarL/FixJ family response regulator